jgi:hypothetical protein
MFITTKMAEKFSRYKFHTSPHQKDGGSAYGIEDASVVHRHSFEDFLEGIPAYFEEAD